MIWEVVPPLLCFGSVSEELFLILCKCLVSDPSLCEFKFVAELSLVSFCISGVVLSNSGISTVFSKILSLSLRYSLFGETQLS